MYNQPLPIDMGDKYTALITWGVIVSFSIGFTLMAILAFMAYWGG